MKAAQAAPNRKVETDKIFVIAKLNAADLPGGFYLR
jgi:hypothetical protein